jgi:hypothetical protein
VGESGDGRASRSCCLALANETPTKQNAKDRDKSQQDSHQKQELSVTLPPSIDVTVSGKVQIEGNKRETEARKEQETFPIHQCFSLGCMT